jgi:hypothetical protein
MSLNLGLTPLQLDYLFASVDNPVASKARGILSLDLGRPKTDPITRMILNQINAKGFHCYTKYWAKLKLAVKSCEASPLPQVVRR